MRNQALRKLNQANWQIRIKEEVSELYYKFPKIKNILVRNKRAKKPRQEANPAVEENLVQNMANLSLKEDESTLSPSAGYRSEKTLKKEEQTYAGIPVKFNEEGSIGYRWPTPNTALKADLQKLELLETLTNFINTPNNRG